MDCKPTYCMRHCSFMLSYLITPQGSFVNIKNKTQLKTLVSWLLCRYPCAPLSLKSRVIFWTWTFHGIVPWWSLLCNITIITVNTKLFLTGAKIEVSSALFSSQRSNQGEAVFAQQSCTQPIKNKITAVCANASNYLDFMPAVEKWLCSQRANEVCPCQWVTHSKGTSLAVLKKGSQSVS